MSLSAASLSKLDNTVSNNSIFNVPLILYKMVNALSFSQPYLCKQPPLQSPLKIRFPTSAIFQLPIPPLLVHKIIPTVPTSIPFLYTSAIFQLPIFAHSQP